MQTPALMTLGNMRLNGVWTLAAWCLDRGCDHFRVIDVSGNSDAVLVRDYNLRSHAHATEQIHDVAVVHADAAPRHKTTDRSGVVGAVDRKLIVREHQRGGAHRIFRRPGGNYPGRPVASDLGRRA